MTEKGKKKSKISGYISTFLFSLFLVSSYFVVSIKNSDLDLAKDPDMDPLNINFNQQSREKNIFFFVKNRLSIDLIIMQGLLVIRLAITKVISISISIYHL